jgi:hypothetical protein
MFKTFVFMLSLVVVMMCVGCPDYGPSQATIQSEQRTQNAESLMEKQPAPIIEFSMDRFLLKERLERFNDPNKMSYMYVFAPTGHIVQYTIIGKVASTSKRLNDPYPSGTSYGPERDAMGVWGESSGNSKVGMSTLGSLIEFGGYGFFMYSETPLHFENLDKPIIKVTVEATPPEIIEFNQRIKRSRNPK